MKVEQSFEIAEPRERLWEFFEQVDEVAKCVPGVESVEVIDADNSKVRVTQSVGPMTATFDLKMRITEREPNERMQFTAIGRAVKGAAGNLRSSNTVTLQPTEAGTRVNLVADLAMGGVLGSVGQKVIAKQASAVTRDFMSSLERAVKGEAVGPAAPAAPATASKDGAGASGGTSARPAGQATAVPAAGASFDGEAPAGIFVSYDFLRGTALGALLATLAILFLGARR
ncbi:MAG TPA: SRPBCC domain-containing protein [Solirubrobacterales bacterium]|nr:SRPBCC domain-containing protein [Solirubrobacterales bacterium]